MSNFIGIDISLNSTAIYIENDSKQTILSFTNKKENNIYIQELKHQGVLVFHIDREKTDVYSDNEMLKLLHYRDLSDLIIEQILNNIDSNKKTYCQIEGYSFSKNTSSILDIVSLSTMIRLSLINNIDNIDISIISPSTLKLETCKLVYPPIDIGKRKPRLKYVNKEGISGGSFKKPDMFKAMLDGNIDCPILNMLWTYKDLTERKKIPNPIEDIIDSILACKLKKKEIIE